MKERKEDEDEVTRLSSGEFERCIALVIMNRLTLHISRHDRVPPSGATDGSPVPIGSCISPGWLCVTSGIS